MTTQPTSSTSQIVPACFPTVETKSNAISVDELFALYERAGFLYPAKMQKLSPYLPLIRENWRKAMRLGDKLLVTFTHHDSDGNPDSSISTWRSTALGWVSQHLVSVSANPLSTRSVLLGAQAAKIDRGDDDSQQNWFRPENRYPARVFGSVVATLGSDRASVQPYALFSQRRHTPPGHIPFAPRVVSYDGSHADALLALARTAEGTAFVRAEDLASDPLLEQAGMLYREAGLFRGRQIWMAYQTQRSEPVAALLAYRGPLGMNFSFLENRCHIIVNPEAQQQDVAAACSSLLNAAMPAYSNFEPDAVPVVIRAGHSAGLAAEGLEFARNYNQSIWTREAFPDWYRHVDAFYARLLTRMDRRSAVEVAQ